MSDEEKRSNRRLERERIVAAHGIGKMKIWRIAADRYRNPPRRHTVMMKNVAGLHNRMSANAHTGLRARSRLNQRLLRNESNANDVTVVNFEPERVAELCAEALKDGTLFGK